MRLKLLDRSLCFTQAHAPKTSAQYPEFVVETSDALRRVKANESTITWETLMHTLETMLGYESVWLTDMVMLALMQTENVCCNCAVTTHYSSWTLFQHRDWHKCTWCDCLDLQSSVTHSHLHFFSWLNCSRKCWMFVLQGVQNRRPIITWWFTAYVLINPPVADIPGVQGVQWTPGIEENKQKNRFQGIR